MAAGEALPFCAVSDLGWREKGIGGTGLDANYFPLLLNNGTNSRDIHEI